MNLPFQSIENPPSGLRASATSGMTSCLATVSSTLMGVPYETAEAGALPNAYSSDLPRGRLHMPRAHAQSDCYENVQITRD